MRCSDASFTAFFSAIGNNFTHQAKICETSTFSLHWPGDAFYRLVLQMCRFTKQFEELQFVIERIDDQCPTKLSRFIRFADFSINFCADPLQQRIGSIRRKK